ncbi:glycosyltransferase family 39 protein [Actinoplanes sp. NPDC051633]|uniref:glycosyltransferase family 39 protein n=1 Tax=Actinoplanes sp. NPDC051633 TaxID=3155670 RepID=UPI00342D705F
MTTPTGRHDPAETVIIVPQQRDRSDMPTVQMAFPAGHAVDLWEKPAPPEPLDAPWLRQVAWLAPTLLTLVLGGAGAWLGNASWTPAAATPWATDALRWYQELAGDSTLALRAPSVVAMTAATAFAAMAGARTGGLRVAVTAGLLFAALPTTSGWARQPGPEPVSVMLAALATVLLVSLVRKPRVVAGLGYAITIALLGASGGLAAYLIIGAHAVGLAAEVRDRRTPLIWGFAAVVGGGLAALPIIIGHADVLDDGRRLSMASTWLPIDLFGGALLAGAVLALAFLGLSLRHTLAVLTTWALLPVVALAAAAAFLPVWSSQTLLITTPAWCLVAAVGLRRFTLARGVAVILAIALLAVPAHLDLRRADHAPAWVIRS